MEPAGAIRRLGAHGGTGSRRNKAPAVNVSALALDRISRPGVPAARSWGSEPRARGPFSPS
jgi:hypothetical protein